MSGEGELAALIERHAWGVGLGRCSCGWEPTYKDSYAEGEEDDEEAQWATHLATYIRPALDAGKWLAWGEGFTKAGRLILGMDDETWPITPNPYPEPE